MRRSTSTMPAGQRVKKLVRTQGGGCETTVYIDGIFERRRWAASGATSATTTVHHVMDDTRRIALVRVRRARIRRTAARRCNITSAITSTAA